MILIRWEPLREIETLQKEMNRLFDQLGSSELSQVGSGAFLPAAEMNKTEEAIDLRVEIPGVVREDINFRSQLPL
nr:hypothetical protein [Pseudanabaena sp. FACHB-2040]